MPLLDFLAYLLTGDNFEKYVTASETQQFETLRRFGFVVDAERPDPIVAALINEDEKALGTIIQDQLDAVAREWRPMGRPRVRYPGDPLVIDKVAPSTIAANTPTVVEITGWFFGNAKANLSLRIGPATGTPFPALTCSEGDHATSVATFEVTVAAAGTYDLVLLRAHGSGAPLESTRPDGLVVT